MVNRKGQKVETPLRWIHKLKMKADVTQIRGVIDIWEGEKEDWWADGAVVIVGWVQIQNDNNGIKLSQG